jgi:hypothetical protein
MWLPEGEAPPLAPVGKIDRLAGRREDETTRLQHVRQRARVVLGIGRDLGPGDVAGRLDEGPKLRIRHGCRIDPESVDFDAMDGRLLRIVVIGAHAEGAAGNPDHVGRRGGLLFQRVHHFISYG